MLTLTLPFPPSVNRYWRHVGKRTLLSREGREFRKRVCAALSHREIKHATCELSVEFELHPPDRRRRDCDNFLKAAIDALEHAGVYEDDSQIVHLDVRKHEPFRGGRTIVRIEPIDQYEARRAATFELACCAGCGRDTHRRPDDRADPYCPKCIEHGETHAVPEDLDREPLGEAVWFGGHTQYDLENPDMDDDEDDLDE